MKRYWPLILLVVFFALQSISFSAPGDRVAYPTRPMHDRLSSSVHTKISTSMLLATPTRDGRMSKDHYKKLQKIGEPTYLAKGNVGDSNHVQFSKPYHAIKLLGLPATTEQATTTPILGVNDYSVATWARYGAYSSNFGYPWTSSLHRIDFAVKTAASLGVKQIRSTIHFTQRDLLSTNINGTAPLSFDGDEGWEGLDRLLELAELYGLKVVLTFTPPLASDSGWGSYAGGSYDFTKLMNYWYLPFASYVSQRYAGYFDILALQPANEILTPFPPPHDSDWVSFQTQIYDIIKQYSDIPVILSGAYHVVGNDPYNGVPGFLDRLNAAGKMDKFDRCVDVHLYPNIPNNDEQVATVGRANLNPVLALGSGAPEDVVEIISKLDAYGRSDAKVMVGEFGLFWEDGTLTKETASATDLVDTWNYYKGNARIDSLNYYTFWGRDYDEPEPITPPGIGGLVGQPGMGLVIDQSNRTAHQGAMIVSDDRGRQVEAVTSWTTPGATNITASATSYGDVNRFVFRRANGTEDAPTAITSNQVISNIGFRGHDGSNFSSASRAIIEARATENYTSAAQGTSLGFATTPPTTISTQTRLLIEDTGNVAIGTINDAVPAAGAMLDVKGTIKSRTGGYIFPDATTQNTAAKPVCTVTDGAIQFNSSGDLSCNGQLYTLGSGTLYAADLYLSASDPALFTDDYTTTGLKTAPSSTIFKGLSDRIPVLTASYIPFSTGTAYTGDAGLVWDNTNKRLGVGTTPSNTFHVKNDAAIPLVIERSSSSSAAGLLVLYNPNTTAGNSSDLNFNTSDGTNTYTGARLRAVHTDHTDTSEDSDLVVQTVLAGAITEKLRIASTGLITNANGGGSPFGHQFFNDLTGLTIAVAASNTWYEIDGAGTTFTAGQLKNVAQSDHYLVATTAGYYKVDYCVSIDTTNPGDEIAATVAVNGTADVSAHSHSTVAAGNSAAVVCGTTFLNLAASDQVSIVVENHTAARDIMVHHAQLGLDYKGAP